SESGKSRSTSTTTTMPSSSRKSQADSPPIARRLHHRTAATELTEPRDQHGDTEQRRRPITRKELPKKSISVRATGRLRPPRFLFVTVARRSRRSAPRPSNHRLHRSDR